MAEDMDHRIIVRKGFRHLGVRYLFQWNLQHHRQFDQNHSRDLWYALLSVAQGRIPLNAFESEQYDRASRLRMPRRVSDEWFISHMEDEGILDTCAGEGAFEPICGSVARLRKVPDRHFQVQDYLLKNELGMVAMEVPVWSGFLRLTGHVDLVRICPSCMEIIDYKPEGRFLCSMPQVAAYTYLLSSCYPTLKLEDMRCVSFNEREAWIYSPEILRHLGARVEDGNVIEEIIRRYRMLRGG